MLLNGCLVATDNAPDIIQVIAEELHTSEPQDFRERFTPYCAASLS